MSQLDKNQKIAMPIAIVGIDACFAGSINIHEFWKNIVNGNDLMTDVPENHWHISDYYNANRKHPDKVYAKRGSFLPYVDFDPIEFGIPPDDLLVIDTVQLLSLMIADRMLKNITSVQSGKVNKKNISVILGVLSITELMIQMSGRTQRPYLEKTLRKEGIPENQIIRICNEISSFYPPWKDVTTPGFLSNVVAGRIANRLDLGGTNCTVDAACASSLSAIKMAMQELELGQADLVITGGADAINDAFMFMCFSKPPAFSPTGDCRPFSEQADGTLLGEGLGLVGLRRLYDAEKDGDKIYGILRGIGASSDGRSKSVYAPSGEAQALVIQRAYSNSGINPFEVTLIEAHGTATKAGDAAEFEGLRRIFAKDIDETKRQYCALGSVKSQIGHTKAAAGAAGLLKAVMALHYKILPPTIKIDRPNSKLNISESPFYLNTQKRPWVHSNNSSRKAGVSAFGFGGSNYHLIVEEYNNAQHRPLLTRYSPCELILISETSQTNVISKLEHITNAIHSYNIIKMAKESQLNFNYTQSARLAILVNNKNDFIKTADMVINLLKEGRQSFSIPNVAHYHCNTNIPKIAFLFSGQGSQYLNMGNEIVMEFTEALDIWNIAADIHFNKNIKLHDVVYPIPSFNEIDFNNQKVLLNQTEWAQPAIGALSLSQLAILNKLRLKPHCTAGHSYGEIVALFAAGVINSTQELLTISRVRGELMAKLAEKKGGMTAVTINQEELINIIRKNHINIEIANINSPKQIVVSGDIDSIKTLEAILLKNKIPHIRLPVEIAFHSQLTQSSVKPFHSHIKNIKFSTSKVPVYNNTTATQYPKQVDKIKEILAAQLAKPVQFYEQILNMYKEGIQFFLEIGPNDTLTKFIKDSLKDKLHYAVSLDKKGQDSRITLWNALGLLSSVGYQLNFSAIWDNYTDVENDNVQKLSESSIQINGTNYGKPYSSEVNRNMPIIYKNEKKDTMTMTVLDKNTQNKNTDILTETTLPTIDQDKKYSNLTLFNTIENNLASIQNEFQKILGESHLAFLKASEEIIRSIGKSKEHTVHPKQEINIKTLTNNIGIQPGIIENEENPVKQDHNNYQAILFQIITDKTGYPEEMLSLTYSFEADLGIDSLKKVEIFQQIIEKIPHLESVLIPSRFREIDTLGKLYDLMQSQNKDALPLVDTVESENKNQNDKKYFNNLNLAQSQSYRYGVKAILKPASGFAINGLLTIQPLYILKDNRGVCAILKKKFSSINIPVKIVNALPKDAKAVLCLPGVNTISSIDEAIELNKHCYLNVINCAQSLYENQGFLISVQNTGGQFCLNGVPQGVKAWSAGIGALAKVASKEWPKSQVKIIDIDCDMMSVEKIAHLIFTELTFGGTEIEVGFNNTGKRYGIETYPLLDSTLSPHEYPLREDDVVIVTGGGLGITADCLLQLANTIKMKACIIGRTELLETEPDYIKNTQTEEEIRSSLLNYNQSIGEKIHPLKLKSAVSAITKSRYIQETLRTLRSKGWEVMYRAADISHAEIINKILQEVRMQFKHINGIIHGAGVIADNHLHNQKIDEYELVFNTKVHGFLNVLHATQKDKLKFICCFSSIAARFGSVGQANYAMANEVLNKVCQEEFIKRKDRCFVKAINWGPWDGGMVNENIKNHFIKNNIPFLSKEAGSMQFVNEMLNNDNQVEVVIYADKIQDLANNQLKNKWDMVLNKRNFPFLEDHIINGEVVVPFVFAIELALKVTHSLFPQYNKFSVENIKLLKGIKISNFTRTGLVLSIVLTKMHNLDDEVVLDFNLVSLDETIHYRFTVKASHDENKIINHRSEFENQWKSKYAIYGKKLFLGKTFQVIKELKTISDKGCNAILSSDNLANNNSLSNFFILDGGLQLAFLWRDHYDSCLSLPTSIDKLTFTKNIGRMAVHCILDVLSINKLSTKFNITFYEEGNRVAKIEGLSMHVLSKLSKHSKKLELSQ